jgi:hypothetical protein
VDEIEEEEEERQGNRFHKIIAMHKIMLLHWRQNRNEAPIKLWTVNVVAPK